MCTVTYLPLNKGAIITSNRDEKVSRGLALPPKFYHINQCQIAFPKDSKAGGSWFVTNKFGITGVLLNGAFNKHTPENTYKLSRGLVLLDLFQFDSPSEAIKKYNLKGIENFTIIIWEARKLWEFRWDGELLYEMQLDEKESHIWSSVTLYDKEKTKKRHDWFYNWLNTENEISQYNILDFHSSTRTDNKEYGLLRLKENDLKTTSCTSIVLEEKKATLLHRDLIQNIESSLEYDLIITIKEKVENTQ